MSSTAQQQLTAYEKAAQAGIDPRCIPQKLTGTVPVGADIAYPNYPASDHETWQALYNRQMSLLQGRICQEYIKGAALMGFQPQSIPSLSSLSKALSAATGWQVARVPGLIHEEDFFGLLRQSIFPSTDYIRGKEELDYTPAPDLFHDIFGHMPLLTNTDFANFYRKFGQAALNARPEQHIMLERFHWFTVEFGLIATAQGMRIYGAGIISSLTEVSHSLSGNVQVKPFNPQAIVQQEYEVWHLQPLYFAIESFEQLEQGFTVWSQQQGLLP